mmetsp:Transcript_10418/g.31437  ORF Transcript_10418/g.31437 Transcript_10418/m.31437 type:complete len:334 (-) Transcript_10418:446-1447(-)
MAYQLEHRRWGQRRSTRRSSSMAPVPEHKPLGEPERRSPPRRRKNNSCPPVFTGLPTVSIEHLRKTAIYDQLVAQDEESRLISAAFSAAQSEGLRLRRMQDAEPIYPCSPSPQKKESPAPALADLLWYADQAIDASAKIVANKPSRAERPKSATPSISKPSSSLEPQKKTRHAADDPDVETKQEEAFLTKEDALSSPEAAAITKKPTTNAWKALFLALLVAGSALFFVQTTAPSPPPEECPAPPEALPAPEPQHVVVYDTTKKEEPPKPVPPRKIPQIVLAPLEPPGPPRRRGRGFFARRRLNVFHDEGHDDPADADLTGPQDHVRPVPTIVG